MLPRSVHTIKRPAKSGRAWLFYGLIRIRFSTRRTPGPGGGVGFEDRQDLLAYRSARITTHYSAAELSMLIEAANRVCESNRRHPELVVPRISAA